MDRNETLLAWRRSQHAAAHAMMQVVNAEWHDRNKHLIAIWRPGEWLR